MMWTIGIAAVAFVLIGGFWLYNNVLMPAPEALDRGTSPVTLPTPDVMRNAPPTQERAPEEEPAPKAPEEAVAAPEEAVAAPEEATAAPEEAVAPAEEAVAAPEEAAEAPTEAVAEAPVEPPAQPEVAAAAPDEATAEEYKKLLTKARRQGFRRSAEQVYEQALALDPNGSDALSGLAMLLLNRGKNTEAAQRALQAVTHDPTNSEGWIVLGASRAAAGDNAGSREAYQSCAETGKGKYVRECRRMLR